MTSKEYWELRQLETFSIGEEEALKLAKELKKQYEKAIQNIENQINAFYGKYQKETGLDMRTIKKTLDKKELKNFNEKLAEYIKFAKQNEADEEFLEHLQLLKYKANISRLVDLETNIEYEIAKLNVKNYKTIASKLGVIYNDSYLRNIFNLDKFNGLAVAFTRPNIAAVEKYLSKGFNLANYSVGKGSVWANVAKLKNILDTRIPQGLLLGQNPKKVAAIASKELNTNYNSTVRLVRTEYNYILNQATKDSYKECGIGQYQFLVALDERTCENCGQYDLYVGNYSDIEIGVNYPPLHVNCRCTTIPYFDPDEFDIKGTRIARDKDGQTYKVPEDLTWDEWKRGLVEHKGKLHYFNKKK